MKKAVFTVFTICWMTVIFAFSAKQAAESQDMSMSVGRFVGKTFVLEYRTWNNAEQTEFAERIDYSVRKIAHITEFAILGILLLLMLKSYGLKGTRLSVMSFMVGAGYAATDELHQRFVPGRSCQFTDVLIDSGGVLCGIIIFLLLSFLFHKIEGNHRYNYFCDFI